MHLPLIMKKNSYSCEICCNKTDYNFIVICPYCNIEICENCFQYSITMEMKNPVCIYCKKGLSLEFILSNNETSWCKNEFIPYFENLNLEIEKTYLIDSMPAFNKRKTLRNLRKELQKIESNKRIEKTLEDIYIQKFSKDWNKKITFSFQKELNEKLENKKRRKENITEQINNLEDSKKPDKIEKKKYICNCPEDKCRGFITDEFFCEICNLQICKLCMVKKKNVHDCNRDDIESADLIKNSSKPCPKCYIPIFKISGCNQMFCTNCHVVFDWKTLIIDNGNVHNAHYFDWITNQDNNINTNIEEIACGDITEIFRNIWFKLRDEINDNYYKNWEKHAKLRKIFEINRIFNGEIIPNIRRKLKNNFEKYRVDYLDNIISEKQWKSKNVKDKINNEKYNSVIEILDMFVTVTSDFIRQLSYKEITLEKFMKNYKEFYIYFYKSIDDLYQIFGGNIEARIENLLDQCKPFLNSSQEITI